MLLILFFSSFWILPVCLMTLFSASYLVVNSLGLDFSFHEQIVIFSMALFVPFSSALMGAWLDRFSFSGTKYDSLFALIFPVSTVLFCLRSDRFFDYFAIMSEVIERGGVLSYFALLASYLNTLLLVSSACSVVAMLSVLSVRIPLSWLFNKSIDSSSDLFRVLTPFAILFILSIGFDFIVFEYVESIWNVS